jgi:N-acetyl-anhydromuramyl-L-alanine amidase AmpD
MTLLEINNMLQQRKRMIGSAGLMVMLAMTGCASQSFVESPSSNYNSRVRHLVIHYTSENFARSHALLTEPSDNPVSSHYLIPEPGDATYEERSLKVYHLVSEARRAWHAGVSHWDGGESLNDDSIGIELVNKSYCIERPSGDATNPAPDELCFFPDFAEGQMALLFELVADIVRRHPDIKPTAIVGHADIAPDRKVDPGPRFPWQRLYRYGFGAWYDDDTLVTYWEGFRTSPPPVALVQRALHEYGYQIELTGEFDRQTQLVMRAFQMHFRPMLITGDIDAESEAVLFALLEKYRPERLETLLRQTTYPESSASDEIQDTDR